MFYVRLEFEPHFFLIWDVRVTMIQYRNFLLGFSVLLLCFCGCPASNGNLGTVEGVVTLNSAPVEGATVRFYPTNGERGSSGKTDKDGHYELRYTRSEMGAYIGEHKVTVSTEVIADGYGTDDGPEAHAETIPKKYSDQKTTELTAAVKSGSNTIPFDLESE